MPWFRAMFRLNFLCLLAFCTCFAREPPTVTIPGQGTIRGKEISMVRTQRILAYLGIPYAMPPIDGLRFAPPVFDVLPSWDDVRNATEYAAACYQNTKDYQSQDIPFLLISDRNYYVDEDCLYLNVFVPFGKPPPGGFATVIWFHPGNFTSGNPAIWNPFTLVYRQRIIIVTVAWRLNIMGFFTTMDGEAPGNFGLMDQQAAMYWVKNNINLFNGNPNNICLMGYGTGAVSVGLHMINPDSRELFSKAIVMSGNILSPSIIKLPEEDKALLDRLAENFGCFRTPTSKLIQCLRGAGADDLVAYTTNVNWGPVIDKGLSNSTTPFLSELPRAYFDRGEFHKIPFLTGYTDMEEVLSLDMLLANMTNSTVITDEIVQSILTEIVSRDLPNNNTNTETCNYNLEHIIDSVMFFYGPVVPIKDLESFRKLLTDFLTEKIYGSSTFLCAKYISLYNDTYVYRFDVKPSTKAIAELIPEWVTVPHLFDLIYVWGVPYWGQLPEYQEWDNRDKSTSDLIMSFWANFAKYSNPTKNNIYPINWDLFTIDNPGILIIERTLNMSNENSLNYKAFEFWNEYYPKVVKIATQCNTYDSATCNELVFKWLILFILLLRIV